MSLIGLLIVVAMLVCLPLLVVNNPQTADLNYYFGEMTLPLSHWLLIAFIAGFFAALLILLPLYLRQRYRIRKARKRIILLEKEAGLESTVDSITRSRRWQKKAAGRARLQAAKQDKKIARSSLKKPAKTSSEETALPAHTQPDNPQMKNPGGVS